MRRLALIWIMLAGILCLNSPPALTDVLIVLPDGTGDFPTIQAALAVVQDGDVVELGDGIFTGPGNADFFQWIPFPWHGGTLTIRSGSGSPELCVIDGEGTGEFWIEGRIELHVRDLQFRDVGFLTGDMGPTPNPPIDLRVANCIFSSSSVVMWLATEGTFSDCHFDDSGIFGSVGASFTGCRFAGHHSAGSGGAIHIWGWLTVDACVFTGNSAEGDGGAIYQTCSWEPTVVQISGSVFSGNTAGQSGGAIAMIAAVNQDPCGLFVSDCTFHGNAAPVGSGIAADGLADLERCIVANGAGGAAVACLDAGAFTLVCCDLYGNDGGDWVGCVAGQEEAAGSFSADPCFCDAQAGNFLLCEDSWCLPGNHPWGCDELVGAFGQGCAACDCTGPVSNEAISWGAAKALYR
jgi:predicted outer membrane repeat protein